MDTFSYLPRRFAALGILTLTSLFGQNVYAQSQAEVDKAFAELDRETGSCNVQIARKNELIAKATQALKEMKDKQDALETSLADRDKAIQLLQNTQASNNAEGECSKGLSSLTQQHQDLEKRYALLSGQNKGLMLENEELKKQKTSDNQIKPAFLSNQTDDDNKYLSQIASLKAENLSLKQQLAGPKATQVNVAVDETMRKQNALLTAKVGQLERQNEELKTRLTSAKNSVPEPNGASKASPQGKLSKLKIKEHNVSSYHTVNSSRWTSNNLVDGNLGTKWISQYKKVKGQTIKLVFDDEIELAKVNFSVSEDAGTQPIKSVNFYFSDGSSQSYQFEKKWGWQRLSIVPIRTSEVMMELELYESDKTNHMMIDEIELYGS